MYKLNNQCNYKYDQISKEYWSELYSIKYKIFKKLSSRKKKYKKQSDQYFPSI